MNIAKMIREARGLSDNLGLCDGHFDEFIQLHGDRSFH